MKLLSSAAIAVALMSSGCAAVALTGLGVGGATAVNHTLTGITYKTFTAPLPQVKTASLNALKRMGLKVDGIAKEQGKAGNEIVKASGNERDIEITLEPISPNTTRMRVTARSSGVLYDSATATEIILQTEKVIGNT